MLGSVLVVGAGPAGMRASSELVNQGFKVFLVEEKPTIGGKMAQIDKMFPSNECSSCTIMPRMLEIASNPNINIIAFAEVESISGEPGDFKVKVRKKPRYVDPMRCNACTACFAVCPVGGVPMEFNLGRGAAKAISFYSPFPPRKALIHPQKCDYLLKGECGDQEQPPCVQACERGAIAFSQKPETGELHVGAVIIATGSDELHTDRLAEYGYGKMPNVLTALEYERLLSGLGPTGGVVKRDDGTAAQTVAWYVMDSAATIGFMTAVTEAMGTIEKNPDASVWVLHEDLNISRESYNDFIQRAQEANVDIVPADSVVTAAGTNGNINISHQYAGRENELDSVDMFVLVPPLAPSESAQKLAQNIDVQLNPWGFFDKQSGDSHPIHTSREGIFVCGSALEPKGIDDAAVQACAAASHAAALLSAARGTAIAPPPQKEYLPITSEDEPSIAALICRCGPNIGGLLDIDELAEYTASLPYVDQVELAPFGCDGVKIREMLRSKAFNRVLIGGCSPKTHEDVFAMHTEGGGINRYLMEIVNLRNHCTWVHSKDPKEATEKAKTLMRMGAGRVALQEPLEDIRGPVSPAALVIGATPSGVACALKLAQADLQVYLVEKESDLRAVKANQSKFITRLINALDKAEKARIFTGAQLGAVQGFMGNFNAEIVTSAGKEQIDIGAIVIATDQNI
ncbi:MAG: CoB--CoM heterodisulfide reductase iron-sulfur subunit A family protein, partial [Deltaproteobacteria bacterium]|nr:CoB--CoM heterodisulfide reductase iron-sulfur subunit A family protein [Deltaproteobacteria bacterium]